MNVNPIPKLVSILVVVYALLLSLLVIERICYGNEYEAVFKGLASIGFLLLAFVCCRSSDHDKKYKIYMMTGLFFMFIADVSLVFDELFIIGVAFFSLGHVMFVIAFMRYIKPSLKQFAVVASLAICMVLVVILGPFDFEGMMPFVIIYAIIIATMVGTAMMFIIEHHKGFYVDCITMGAILFLISDVVLMFYYFYLDQSMLSLSANNMIYYAAQGIIAVSFLGNIKKKNSDELN